VSLLEIAGCFEVPSGKPGAFEIFTLSLSLSLSGEEQVGERNCECPYGYFGNGYMRV
jgi:hypothetical protein